MYETSALPTRRGTGRLAIVARPLCCAITVITLKIALNTASGTFSATCFTHPLPPPARASGHQSSRSRSAGSVTSIGLASRLITINTQTAAYHPARFLPTAFT